MLLKMSAVWSLSDWPSLTWSSRPYIELLGPRDVLLSGRASLFYSLSTLRAYIAVTLVWVHQVALVEAVGFVRGTDLQKVVADNPEVLTCSFRQEQL